MSFWSIPEVRKFFDTVLNPVVSFLFVAATMYFIYGVFKYIVNSEDSEARAEGGRHILWSTIGLFIMISVWGILAIIKKSVGQ